MQKRRMMNREPPMRMTTSFGGRSMLGTSAAEMSSTLRLWFSR